MIEHGKLRLATWRLQQRLVNARKISWQVSMKVINDHIALKRLRSLTKSERTNESAGKIFGTVIEITASHS